MAKLDTGTTINNNTAWHAGNDGSTSTLDADLLDGKSSSDFANSTHNHDGTYAKVGNYTTNGSIKVSGDTIYIYDGDGTAAWRQVYPAVYS